MPDRNAETVMSTNASDFGILPMILKLLQAKVPITTINITPTRAAYGISSITLDPKRTNISNESAATIPDKRPRSTRIYIDDGLTNHSTTTHSTK